MKLAVIVPTLPPAINGLGDYTATLHRQLQPSSWSFIVNSADQTESFSITADVQKIAPTSESLIAALKQISPEQILLQYVGYAYSPDGAPCWLIDGLSQWLSENHNCRLLVMFHELWATGLPWTKTFWQTSAQKNCALSLLRLAVVSVTSNEKYQRILRTENKDASIKLIPIGSNLTSWQKTSKDWRKVLIFGRNRQRTLTIHRKLLRLLDHSGLLDCLVLAGKSEEPPNNRNEFDLIKSLNLTARVETVFDFPYDQAPQALSECGFSLMHTQSSLLLKSGIFHASALAGQIAICTKDQPAGLGFYPEQHYLDYTPGHEKDLLPFITDYSLLKQLSERCQEHYLATCNWESIADKWSKLLRSESLSYDQS
ncbi:MAG: glycosyltransferase [Candidatus Obscuribacterales bacterium]|nr:glycosyltransferase [Candidatus Obscuribacterales bacterium]